ncbi:hypothetical protein FPOAC1_007901 [Fusarium poae]|uniref:hypothetical protein n=1 Tax=Fusarium poae TaxID=36050 RepID=UPI001CEA9956|nr:hypothetical protein FPOAC1_007901 [Fusarium poae]KAG8668518.1 hypothetical protein FPOAC1_007901 [Fusarium poae]
MGIESFLRHRHPESLSDDALLKTVVQSRQLNRFSVKRQWLDAYDLQNKNSIQQLLSAAVASAYVIVVVGSGGGVVGVSAAVVTVIVDCI